MQDDEGGGAESDDDAVARALSSWRQGDVIEGLGAFVVRTIDPQDGRLVDGEIESVEAVITSQTCDIVRKPSEVPNVEVVALVRLPEEESSEARKFRRPAYVHVPGAGPDAFAYPAVVMSVDKRALVELKRTTGCPTEKETRAFADGLCRRIKRFAFPDDVHRVLSKLRDRLKAKHRKQSDEGRAVDCISEVFASAEPDWRPSLRQVTLHFIVPEDAKDDEIDFVCGHAKQWESKCRVDANIPAFLVDVCRLTDISAALYLTWARVDFDGISPDLSG